VKLNLHSAFYVGQAANAVMQQGDGGSIVKVGSISAHDRNPGTSAHTAAKAGLLALTRALALEWAPKVRVNHVMCEQVLTSRWPTTTRASTSRRQRCSHTSTR
jgi:NAD(P)-dependent dehydrogenase (short-subunit alcohol dehydrogenase family)